MDYYNHTAIPNWQNSLLVTALKLGRVYRVPLGPNGQVVTGDATEYFTQIDRFRDLAIAPDGLKIYIATDSVGQVRGNTPGEAFQVTHRGCILEFTYLTTSTGEAPDAGSLRLFPNPVRDVATLDLGNRPSGELRLQAFNHLGARLLDTRLDYLAGQRVGFRVGGWPEGHYTLSVQLGNEKPVMKKFAVTR